MKKNMCVNNGTEVFMEEGSAAVSVDTGEVVLYTVDDIQRMFKMGRTKAYELMSAKGFPSFRINSRLYVEKNKLCLWISKRDGKTFST